MSGVHFEMCVFSLLCVSGVQCELYAFSLLCMSGVHCEVCVLVNCV